MELTNIGNYRILQIIDPEGQSKTYKVQHKYTEEICALKLVFTDDPDLIDLLNKTYKKLSKGNTKLRSPHIISFKEYFVTEAEGKKCFALVSEFFTGYELEKYINSTEKALDHHTLMRIFLNTCQAVNESHNITIQDDQGMQTMGFPHGDITPWNIMINNKHESKLLDFKISNRYTYSKQKLESDRFGGIVPEQRSSNIISRHTDIFQLGYLLNFLFITGQDYTSWRMEHMSKSEIASKLDPKKTNGKTSRIARVIHRCTRELPADRYQSVDQLMEDLHASRKEKKRSGLVLKPVHLFAAIFILLIPLGYLFKYTINKIESLGQSRGASPISEEVSSELYSLGEDYALLIGNNAYRHLPRLLRPQEDVLKLRSILEDKYGFINENIYTVFDASRDDLYDVMEKLSERIHKNDNLLIFYAGHGQLDGTTGYWIPVEGDESSRRNWISNAELKKFFNSLLARNVLLISDACFGGSILRDINTYKGGRRISNKKSRIALTSGSLESVPDQSVFTDQFLWYLENNQDSLVYASDIYAGIREAVVANTTTDPAYGPIRESGHQGGDFFLRKVK